MVADHGREIDKYEFSDLDKFALHCQRASDTVSKWPAWKQNLLNNEPSCGNREPVDNATGATTGRWTPQPNALEGRKLTLRLPATDYYYNRAMSRSKEIKDGYDD